MSAGENGRDCAESRADDFHHGLLAGARHRSPVWALSKRASTTGQGDAVARINIERVGRYGAGRFVIRQLVQADGSKLGLERYPTEASLVDNGYLRLSALGNGI